MAVTVQVRMPKFPQGGDEMPFLLRAFEEIGEIVKAEAIRRAPKSPSKGQYLKMLQAKRKTPGKSKTRRAGTSFGPGGLERSIDYKMSRLGPAVRVFVGSNTAAGKYGFRMHEDKYKLGPGSEAKQAGARAKVGRKYITRAIADNMAGINAQLDKAVDDFVRKYNT